MSELIGVTFNNTRFVPQLIDLTALFGAGNEPSTVAEFKAMFPADYYPYCSGSFADLLWENASPSSAFAEQDVSCPNEQYSMVMVIAKRTTSQQSIECVTFLSSLNNYETITVWPSYKLAGRDVVRRSNGVHFGHGFIMNTYGTGTTDNTYVVPYRIYGIK